MKETLIVLYDLRQRLNFARKFKNCQYCGINTFHIITKHYLAASAHIKKVQCGWKRQFSVRGGGGVALQGGK